MPAGEEVRSKDLITCERGFHEILFALQLQNFHGPGLRVDEPHLLYPGLRLNGQLGGAVVSGGGRGENFDNQIRGARNPIGLNDSRACIRNEEQVRLERCVFAQAHIQRGDPDFTKSILDNVRPQS